MAPATGTSLIETLAALAIVALLGTAALPAWWDGLQRSKATVTVNSLVAALHQARYQAVRTRQPVTLCPLGPQNQQQDQQQNQPRRCTRTWAQGFSLFSDSNSNAQVDPGEQILRSWPAVAAGASLRWRAFRNQPHIQFTAKGYTNNQNGSFHYCPPTRAAHLARQVIVNRQGRARLARDNNGDGIVESANGSTMTCSS